MAYPNEVSRDVSLLVMHLGPPPFLLLFVAFLQHLNDIAYGKVQFVSILRFIVVECVDHSTIDAAQLVLYACQVAVEGISMGGGGGY